MIRSPLRKKNIECFNWGGLEHVLFNYLGLKDIKIAMQVTWRDVESSESEPLSPNDNTYEQYDYLYFITSMAFGKDDTSASEFDENASIIEDSHEECHSLLNKCIKITTTYKSLKTEHDVLKEEKINYLENFDF